MRKIGIINILLWGCLLLSTVVTAAEVKGVRLWAAPDNTRLVLDTSGAVQHALFSLKKPYRLVIDLKNTSLKSAFASLDYSKGLVSGIRSASRNGKDLRVVLDLRKQVKPRSFLLQPSGDYGYRLVIDLHDQQVQKNAVRKIAKKQGNGKRDLVIAIDAGHGGEDPGAIGHGGVYEKVVVMQIAKRLARRVNAIKGMKAVLIRTGDYYIPLRRRIEIAREKRADMFISIHADAFHNKRARGASVFALSQRGASNEAARWLAEKENAADRIGGVQLKDKSKLLTSVLLDLSMTGTIEASLDLGKHVLGQLKTVGRVHKRHVGQAGFAVLKSPDIPSILVETAFISNPSEARKLKNTGHQEKLAVSIARGVRIYFKRNPVPGTLLASIDRRHAVSRGETIGVIARRYDVTPGQLRLVNNLKTNRLRVGQVLKIPASDG